MASDSKKLILGLLSGLSLEQVKPFFLSLEKCQYRGEVCMVVSDLGVATQAFLRARQVQLVPFQKAFLKNYSAHAAKLPGMILSRRRRPLFDRQIAPAYMHPRCARYFFYQSYLQECGGAYSHLMLTDVRDVMFQADPFAFELPEGLCVFLEAGSQGKATATATVSTGVIMGTAASVREHLARLTGILCKRRDRQPIDKAVHSFLVHQEPPPNLHCFENFSGPALNLGNVDPAALQFAASGHILGRTGQIVNILHQYDRHADLKPKLAALLTQF
ncbi:MAG TPA: hypothetical protein VL970_03515 [Candidatus Acidoferrales bacterium]|nr:hypothetical protein [Candidatus Acidoferrales bacterium]